VTGAHGFVVERYVPRLRPADVELLAARLEAASAELRAEGRDVVWIRSHALPGEETCLCIFAARTRADVEEANRRAGTAYERIVEALTVEARRETKGEGGATSERRK
jgi:hypothetical protein